MERKCRGRGEVGEGCPSEAQEDVDWLTATDALVSRAPVGHVDRPGGKEGACEDRAPEYFQKRIYRSVVMTCRRFQHAMAKASHGRGDVDSFFFFHNNNNNNLDGLGLFCILPRRPLLLTMLMMIDYHQPLSEILNSPL
ncbi:hypothetical protein D917_08180, partial [Trichinella nativa]